jgi:hypothetical protein
MEEDGLEAEGCPSAALVGWSINREPEGLLILCLEWTRSAPTDSSMKVSLPPQAALYLAAELVRQATQALSKSAQGET